MTSNNDDERSGRASRRNLKRALNEIDTLAETLEIPQSTVSTATRVYREFLEETSENRMYGWGIEDTACACLYIACKIDRVPRNAEEFEQLSETSEKQLLGQSKNIRSELDINAEGFTDAIQFVGRYCEELGLSENVETRAEELLELAQDVGTSSGKSPQGLAAAAVYYEALQTQENVTQSAIADVADVSEVTIRNRYQEQARLFRKKNRPPDDPAEIINWADDLIGVQSEILDRAEVILSCAREENRDLNEEGLLWVLGSIRLASEESESPVSMKMLKTISNYSSNDIRAAIDDLRQDLKQSSEYTYRP